MSQMYHPHALNAYNDEFYRYADNAHGYLSMCNVLSDNLRGLETLPEGTDSARDSNWTPALGAPLWRAPNPHPPLLAALTDNLDATSYSLSSPQSHSTLSLYAEDHQIYPPTFSLPRSGDPISQDRVMPSKQLTRIRPHTLPPWLGHR